MFYFFLDESGDLGFDYENKKPSTTFVVTLLAVSSPEARRKIKKAVQRTLSNKLNMKNKKKLVQELKGTNTTLEIKTYFFEQLKDVKFAVYSLVINKKKVAANLRNEKARLYNYVTRLLLAKLPLERAKIFVELSVDKSKGKKEMWEFNRYIYENFNGRINPKVPFKIHHDDSCTVQELQAVDLFSWGIFRKHEHNDNNWHDVFKSKIKSEEKYFG
jgi:hypothetical protein